MARSKMIMVRVDEAEHALFKEAARKVSISMSEYARDAMLARMALEALPVVVQSPGEVVEALERLDAQVGSPPPMIKSPSEAEAVMERVAKWNVESVSPRPFTPYSKEQQTGKAAKKAKAEPAPTCRHGLMRCKVCGSG